MSQSKSKKANTPSQPVSGNKPADWKHESSFSPNVHTHPVMTYGKKQFMYVFIGLGLIALGMILMSGGWMPSPDVWDESIIYSARRTVLAPIFILAGLIVQIYAILSVKSKDE
jgi:hypothetical protein